MDDEPIDNCIFLITGSIFLSREIYMSNFAWNDGFVLQHFW